MPYYFRFIAVFLWIPIMMFQKPGVMYKCRLGMIANDTTIQQRPNEMEAGTGQLVVNEHTTQNS